MTAIVTGDHVATPSEPTPNHAAIREALETLERHFQKPWWRVENFGDLKIYLPAFLVAGHAFTVLQHLVVG